MEHEVFIRIGVFLGLIAFFAVVERMAPKVSLNRPVKAHWITHFSITIIKTMILRLMPLALPFLAMGAALDAAGLEWGFLNFLDWPLWIEVLLSLLILDFTIWAQHDRNYGFSLSVWDGMFGTYREETATPSVLRLQWRDERPTEFRWSLWLPLMRI